MPEFWPCPWSLRGGLDLRVDADDLAVGVEQRAAGVAGVERGVGLDDLVDREAVRARRSERWRAETTPVVSVRSRPNGLPIAKIASPTWTSAESPRVSVRELLAPGSTLSSATSVDGSAPTTRRCIVVPSPTLTLTVEAPGDDVVVGHEVAVGRDDEARAGGGALRGAAEGAGGLLSDARGHEGDGVLGLVEGLAGGEPRGRGDRGGGARGGSVDGRRARVVGGGSGDQRAATASDERGHAERQQFRS